ncbi:MAG: nitroreductase family protein, partial [Oscillospiraceae bacterium]
PAGAAAITAYLQTLANPFGAQVTIKLLETASAPAGEKLGTYGVIKGAKSYLCAAVEKGGLALEGLGYAFEELVLYATSLGLGTCWLGGTFTRSGFAAAMGVAENQFFPAICPIGTPAGKRGTEVVMRWAIGADRRKPWQELFFSQRFGRPLTREEAGPFAPVLDLLRLAPSAENKQPWRVVQNGVIFHFYEENTLPAGKLGIDIQRVDLGIAACHFALAARENGLAGQFETLAPPPSVGAPESCHYRFSWAAQPA